MKIELSRIFDQIRSSTIDRNKVLRQLYFDQEIKSKTKSTMNYLGIPNDEQQSYFNDAIIKFCKTVIKNTDFELQNSLANYISGIIKLSFYSELRKQKKDKAVPQEHVKESLDVTPEDLVIKAERVDIIQSILKDLGKNCKEVLMYWANGYKMKKIAEFLNYKSEGMAKKKKHQCFKFLMQKIETNPELKKVLQT